MASRQARSEVVFKVHAAAKYLGVGNGYVREQVAAGRIAKLPGCRTIYIPKAALDKFPESVSQQVA